MERLKLFHSIKEQKIGSYALLQIENPEMTLEETERILKIKSERMTYWEYRRMDNFI